MSGQGGVVQDSIGCQEYPGSSAGVAREDLANGGFIVQFTISCGHERIGQRVVVQKVQSSSGVAKGELARVVLVVLKNVQGRSSCRQLWPWENGPG